MILIWTRQGLQLKLPNPVANDQIMLQFKGTAYTSQLCFPWTGIFSLTSCNDLRDPSSCPETLIPWFLTTHLTTEARGAETSEQPQHTTQSNLELMWIQAAKFNDSKNNKNAFCLGLANGTKWARTLQLSARKHTYIMQHSIRAYLPLARCASHAERFERWRRCPDCSTWGMHSLQHRQTRVLWITVKELRSA